MKVLAIFSAGFIIGVALFKVLYTYVFGEYEIGLSAMPGFMVILTALGFSVIWVYELKIFRNMKPFNCVKCLTGWTSLVLAFCFNVPLCVCYLFIGALIGGLFERFTMRYL